MSGGAFQARAAGPVLASLACVACGNGARGRILWESAANQSPGWIVLSGGDGGAQQAGTVSGTPANDICPANQVVIGYRGFLSAVVFVNQNPGTSVIGIIQTLCGIPTIRDASPDMFAIVPGATLPARGMDQAKAWSAMCPPDEVMEGFSGRSGSFIDQIQFTCAHWTLSSADGGAAFFIDRTATLPAVGGAGGSPFPFQACPTGQMATGTALQWGQFVDAFGIICGMPSVQADAGGP